MDDTEDVSQIEEHEEVAEEQEEEIVDNDNDFESVQPTSEGQAEEIDNDFESVQPTSEGQEEEIDNDFESVQRTFEDQVTTEEGSEEEVEEAGEEEIGEEEEKVETIDENEEMTTSEESVVENNDSVEMESQRETPNGDDTSFKSDVDIKDESPPLTELWRKDVFVYSIPEDKLNSFAFKATDWNLSEPMWWGQIILLVSGEGKCILNLEESEGELSGQLYGQTVVTQFPGCSELQSVVDSSRYYVMKISKPDQDSSELVGIGFSDRSESSQLQWELVNYFNKLCPVVPSSSADSSEVAEPPIKKQKHSGFLMDTTSPISQQLLHTPPERRVVKEEEKKTKPMTKVEELNFLKKGQDKPGNYSCHICSATFDDMRHIKCHWHRIHNLQHPAHCVVCKLPFPTPQLMVQHRTKFHGFQCPKCQKSFKKPHALEDHFLQVHGKPIDFGCENCGERFPKRDELKNHVGSTHFKEDGSSLLFHCMENGCEANFLTETELTGHSLTHEKRIICEYCETYFQNRSQLKKHLEQDHAGARQSRI